MSSYETALPVEQWQQILLFVPPRDLCRVALTSRQMNSIASWPDLWRTVKVNISKIRKDGLKDLYSVNRFNKITKMDFSSVDFTINKFDPSIEKLLKDILRSPLTEINLYGIKLRMVPKELLARVIFSMCCVNLGFTHLAVDYCVKVLEASCISRTLVNLNLQDVNLSEVPADLLGKAVGRLQAVNLTFTRLTLLQQVKVLEASESSRTLLHLNLKDNNLRAVSAHLLARAVVRLQTANLGVTYLTADQCVKVLQASLSSKTLVNLDFLYINISEGVPALLLGHAVSRLQTMCLHFTHMTTEQSVKVLESSLAANTLKSINLMDVNLSEVPANILAKAVSRLEEANLGYSSLRNDQSVALLEAASHSTTLINLNLTFINLSSVPPDLLTNVISNLQVINLSFTQLGPDLITNVLESIISSKTLVNVDLRRVNLTSAPSDLLARAVCRLQTVNLDYTEMTTQQSVDILESSLSSAPLSTVSLLGVDLSQVPAPLLGGAVARLHHVNLVSCQLTVDQCLKVVEDSLNSRTMVNVNLLYNSLREETHRQLMNSLPARLVV